MSILNKIDKLHTVIFLTVLTVVFFICGFLLGLIPTIELPALGINITFLGKAQNIANNAGLFDFSNDSILYPYGGSVNEGFGMLIITKILILLGVSALNSLSITFFIIFLIAFTALAILLEKITHNKWITVIMTAVYFMSPFLRAQAGIPPMFFGVLIFPLSALCDYFLFKAIYKAKKSKDNLLGFDKSATIAGVLFFSILVRLTIASVGWYSVVISAMGSCLLFLIYSIFEIRKVKVSKLVIRYFVYILIPWVIGMGLILLVTPREAASFGSSMPFFNATSVDIMTLFFPKSSQAIANILPSINSLTGEGNSLSGDGTMWGNYLGYIMIITSLILIFKKKYRNRMTTSVAIVALVIFVLSLGPGLKLLGVVSKDSFPNYNLSLDHVLLFPWRFIYTIFPISSMRAVYRWLFIPEFALLILSSVYLSKLYMRGKWQRAVSIILCILCVGEFLPSNVITGKINAYRDNYTMAMKIQADTIDELKGIVTKDNAITAVCSYDYNSNGFLVPHIAQSLGIKTYAGAGDKALALAKGYIPSDALKLQQTAKPEEIAKNITLVKAKGLCDYVLLPKFALRENSDWWPASDEVIKKTEKIAEGVIALLGNGYTVYQTEHYTVIDLSNTDRAGRYEFIAESLKETKNDNLIQESKALGSKYALTINNKQTIETSLAIPDSDDSLYLLLYLRSSEQDVGELSVTVKMFDEDKNVLGMIKKIIPYDKDYSKFEANLNLAKGVSSIDVTVSNINNSSSAVKSIHLQSYSTKEVLKSDNERMLDDLGFSDVDKAEKIMITPDKAVFQGNSSIAMTDKQTSLGENVDISMELWLNQQQIKEDDARVVNKMKSWQKDMSFFVASKKGSTAFIFSSDGTKWEGLFLKKDVIPVDQWSNLHISFNSGLVKVYVNDALVGEKQLSFNKLFVGDTNLEVGENMEGQIRNFHYTAD